MKLLNRQKEEPIAKIDQSKPLTLEVMEGYSYTYGQHHITVTALNIPENLPKGLLKISLMSYESQKRPIWADANERNEVTFYNIVPNKKYKAYAVIFESREHGIRESNVAEQEFTEHIMGNVKISVERGYDAERGQHTIKISGKGGDDRAQLTTQCKEVDSQEKVQWYPPEKVWDVDPEKEYVCSIVRLANPELGIPQSNFATEIVKIIDLAPKRTAELLEASRSSAGDISGTNNPQKHVIQSL